MLNIPRIVEWLFFTMTCQSGRLARVSRVKLAFKNVRCSFREVNFVSETYLCQSGPWSLFFPEKVSLDLSKTPTEIFLRRLAVMWYALEIWITKIARSNFREVNFVSETYLCWSGPWSLFFFWKSITRPFQNTHWNISATSDGDGVCSGSLDYEDREIQLMKGEFCVREVSVLIWTMITIFFLKKYH